MCTRSGMTGTGVLFFTPTVKKSSRGTGSSFGSAGPRTLADGGCSLDPSSRFCIVDLGIGLVSTFHGGRVEAGLMPDLPVSLMGIFPLVSASPSFFPSPSPLASLSFFASTSFLSSPSFFSSSPAVFSDMSLTDLSLLSALPSNAEELAVLLPTLVSVA